MSIIHEVLFVKNCCHLNLVAFENSATLVSNCWILNFARCIFEDEATKVVVLLPFFEEGMANPVAQRNEHHSRKGFLALSKKILSMYFENLQMKLR